VPERAAQIETSGARSRASTAKNPHIFAGAGSARDVLGGIAMMDPQVELRAHAEQLGSEARRLAGDGREVAALDLYRRAASIVPGAPWLQQRTAELARKLRQHELAIFYFRRAAMAFRGAGMGQRALIPLRSAWSAARDGLPHSALAFEDVSKELADLQRDLGYGVDAELTTEYAEQSLRRAGCAGD
jgi:hypothetical protein